jgi:hypothetical protein
MQSEDSLKGERSKVCEGHFPLQYLGARNGSRRAPGQFKIPSPVRQHPLDSLFVPCCNMDVGASDRKVDIVFFKEMGQITPW